jgi:hypothetical protein
VREKERKRERERARASERAGERACVRACIRACGQDLWCLCRALCIHIRFIWLYIICIPVAYLFGMRAVYTRQCLNELAYTPAPTHGRIHTLGASMCVDLQCLKIFPKIQARPRSHNACPTSWGGECTHAHARTPARARAYALDLEPSSRDCLGVACVAGKCRVMYPRTLTAELSHLTKRTILRIHIVCVCMCVCVCVRAPTAARSRRRNQAPSLRRMAGKDSRRQPLAGSAPVCAYCVCVRVCVCTGLCLEHHEMTLLLLPRLD